MTISRNLSILAEGVSSSGILNPSNGGTGLNSLSSGFIPYGNGTSAFSSSSNLFFDGTNLGIGTTSAAPLGGAAGVELTLKPAAADKYSNINLIGVRDVGGNLNGVISFWNNFGTLTRTSYIGVVNTAGSNTAGQMFFATKTSAGSLTDRVWIDDSGNMWPGADNAYSCGKSGNRWSAVWAANGSIQTSDRNAKTDIVDSPLGLDFIKSLRPVAYKYKVGKNIVDGAYDDENKTITSVPGKRQHFGLIAQEVKEILPNDVDFGGWVQTDLNDENSEQGLRYDQFISPLIKAIQEQQAIIEQLKIKVGL